METHQFIIHDGVLTELMRSPDSKLAHNAIAVTDKTVLILLAAAAEKLKAELPENVHEAIDSCLGRLDLSELAREIAEQNNLEYRNLVTSSR